MFVLSKLVGWITDPATILAALAVGAMVAGLLGRRRLAVRLSVAVTALICLVTVTPIGLLAVGAIERRIPVPALPERIDGIILLGGTLDSRAAHQHGTAILRAGSPRLATFVTLAERYPGASLLYTGGSGSMWDQAVREADVAGPLLRDLFGPDRRIILERESRNTWENAVLSARLVEETDAARWLLVTSAIHMPRAIGCFRRAGWPVTPHPAPPVFGPIASWRPSFIGGLQALRAAVHEAVGLVAYFALGRTPDLLPAP